MYKVHTCRVEHKTGRLKVFQTACLFYRATTTCLMMMAVFAVSMAVGHFFCAGFAHAIHRGFKADFHAR